MHCVTLHCVVKETIHGREQFTFISVEARGQNGQRPLIKSSKITGKRNYTTSQHSFSLFLLKVLRSFVYPSTLNKAVSILGLRLLITLTQGGGIV